MGLFEFIQYAENGHFATAKQMLEGAKNELKSVRSDVKFKYQDEIKIISELIDTCDNDQQLGTKSQAGPAKKAYNEYVKPFLTDKKNDVGPVKEKKSDANAENRNDLVHSNHARKNQERQRANDNQGITQNCTGASIKFDKDQDVINILTDEFDKLYENEWSDVHENLSKQWSEADKVGLLLRIVQEAFIKNRIEATRQITDMEKCARVIVKHGDIQSNNRSNDQDQGGPKGDLSLLVQFRKNHAVEAVSRLQREFRNFLSTICSMSQSIAAYGDKCVEVTWWMCVQDPPMYIMIDGKADKVDPTYYNPYTNKGSRLDYIVWPALLKYKGGPILRKGTAQGK